MAEPEVFSWDACLARVRAGDQRAAEELVQQLYPQVARIIRGRLPRQCALEDIAQDVFMKVFARLHQYQGVVPFPHWVARITSTTCIDQLRRHQTRPELRRSDLSAEEGALVDGLSDPAPSAVPGVAWQARDLVARLLETLPPLERQLIEWLDLEGLSTDEVAARTGWSKLILKVRVYRARRKLQKQLQALMQKEDL